MSFRLKNIGDRLDLAIERVERRLEAREHLQAKDTQSRNLYYPPEKPTGRFVCCFMNGPLKGKRWAYNDPPDKEFHYGGLIYYCTLACEGTSSHPREIIYFFELPPAFDGNNDAELDVIAQQLTGGEEGM